MSAIHLTDQELSEMAPAEIERAFNPLPPQVGRTAEMEEKARGLGLEGIPWHKAETSELWDKDASGGLRLAGRRRCSELRLASGRARIYYVRTGFLEGHYETDDGQKFNHWGGPGGAEHYAAALAAVRGLTPKPPSLARRLLALLKGGTS